MQARTEHCDRTRAPHSGAATLIHICNIFTAALTLADEKIVHSRKNNKINNQQQFHKHDKPSYLYLSDLNGELDKDLTYFQQPALSRLGFC